MNVNILRRLSSPFGYSLQNKVGKLCELKITENLLWNSTRCSSDGTPIPKNVIGHIYSASSQPENGKVYDRKPFKIRLYPKKQYHWCLCGLSKSQPMCDGSHKLPNLKCKLKPIKFEVEEENDYWLCNCKQTKLRPFCDGMHKTLE